MASEDGVAGKFIGADLDLRRRSPSSAGPAESRTGPAGRPPGARLIGELDLDRRVQHFFREIQQTAEEIVERHQPRTDERCEGQGLRPAGSKPGLRRSEPAS